VQIVPSVALGGRGVARALPRQWAVSFDLRATADASVKVALAQSTLVLAGGRHHVEAVPGRLTLDGHLTASRPQLGGTLALTALHGSARADALIISAGDNGGALLLHRVAELHARLGTGQFPVGADRQDRLHIDSNSWMSGFWPGALWQAAALAPRPGAAMFTRWALAATVAHFGQERSDTHDVGFMYGQSSLAAWEALCQRPGTAQQGVCARLRRSVLSAADELVSLEASNRAAGTIPTSSTGSQADTIIDSMMNVAILPWASRVSGDAVYTSVASRHAHTLAAVLVRRDGSTAQSVHFDRASGRILFIHTHQGLSTTSTWSRGQGWAVYGFSQLAQQLRDGALLRVALRAGAYVARHLPSGGVPRWDYDASAGAPIDVSAGVITAAGLEHLSAACRAMPGVCGGSAGRWSALGRRMLAAALAHARTQPPLGLLGAQVLNEHGDGCWCNGGELIFGVSYALEALRGEAADRS